MTPPTPVKPARPLSPHLQVYKPQLTSALSIFHRITGCALAFGLPVFVVWLVCLSEGQDSYNLFISYARSCVGKIFLFGWVWAFFFHMCMGIRHLFWDAGKLLDIKNAYRSGYVAIAASSLLTLAVWYQALWGHP